MSDTPRDTASDAPAASAEPSARDASTAPASAVTAVGEPGEPVGPVGGFALFDTALGRCAIGWNERGIASFQLPGPSDSSLVARLRGRVPRAVETEPPARVAEIIARVVALMGGQDIDLSDVPVDLSGLSGFHQKVYEVTRAIPAGATLTYGAVADRIKAPGSARAVGRALGENPIPVIVPCHRVTAADGRFGGFSAPGGRDTKLALLAAEGAVLPF